jgi:catechol 2,3-dioxygenase-like lactoylglutathione lyase family enzyme
MVGLIHELFMTSTLNLALLLLCLNTTLNGAAETSQSPSSNATHEHPNPSMQLKVDHAGICSYQLEPLQQAFADIGLKAEYGGAHATGGTHNALLGFDDGSYIELIAAQHPETMTGEDAEQWTSLKPDMARACFWAVDVEDIGSSVKELRQAGLDISGPKEGSRKKPDGTVLQWQTAAVNEGSSGNILPFFIQDKTPRTSRIQPSASVQGSDLRGIEIIVLGVKDLDRSLALYRRAFGLPAPTLATDSDFGAKLAFFPGTPVMLAARVNETSWIKTQIEKFGEGPIALLLGTRDFRVSQKRLKLSGENTWFGRKLAWIDAGKLHGARMGVIE